MGVYQSGADGMRAFATARVGDANRVLSVHRGDDTGCCAECGRATPCPAMAAASRTREHYQAWIDSATAPAADQPQADQQHPRLFRPYVLRILRGGR